MSFEILGGPAAEFLAEMIPRAAKAGAKRFPVVPADDFEQAMWERVMRSPEKFRQLVAEGREGVVWEELRRAATKVGKEDDRFRRAQRAAAMGYSPLDEQFYSRELVRYILPELIESEWEVGRAMERALSGSAGSAVKVQVSSSEDAYERYMVTLIDVLTAYRKLNGYHKNLLASYYSVSQEDTEQGRWERSSLASSMGLTAKALQNRVYRATDALISELGGYNPWLRSQRSEQENGSKAA